ncbi:YhcH/YjgK/YiaL family protein [Streptococcus dentasini]
MIIDRMERLEKYAAVLPHLTPALEAMETYKDSWETGVRYPFDGGVVFFQKGSTKPLVQAQFESHKKYIDVQIILAGAEYAALEDLSNLSVAIPYNDEKDVAKYSGETQHYMKISSGMAYVCFPWDGHKAVFHMEEPLTFTKAVIKLEIDTN